MAAIPYRLSTPEVSGTDVTETSCTAFSGTDAIEVRLVVRRVRPTPGTQLAIHHYHAFVTNRSGALVEVEADHRRHAVVEQRIAELKSAGLADLLSGKFTATAAWPALACNERSSPCPAVSCTASTATSTTTRFLGTRHRTSAPRHRGDPAALLTFRPAPTTRTSEKPADRRIPHARNRHQRSPPPGEPTRPSSPSHTVDPGLVSRDQTRRRSSARVRRAERDHDGISHRQAPRVPR